ncbi:outer membrane beta-barrel protein [Agitococcus lubricus]|uniref:Outer membrane protein with beta-barrel domain n=1 Tax=Agitococcus lubricus TaxID=1077255 RepID=A0A2T5J056_9GAMM|nr:outer membrane beta-barrel protein [Agitococcus lubricus]PTQ89619.1 outer membrane protein with beta-barrel domain [Agitococcus lubricus]
MKRLTVALIAALSSPLVLAAEKPFIGIDYQMGTLEFNNNIEADTSAVRLRLGTEVNPYVGVEAHLMSGLNDDTVTKSGVDYTVEVGSAYAVFVRPQLSFAKAGSVYALLGAAYIDKSIETNSTIGSFAKTSGFEHSGAAGVGLDINVYKDFRINVDYTMYASDFSAISAGIRIPLN